MFGEFEGKYSICCLLFFGIHPKVLKSVHLITASNKYYFFNYLLNKLDDKLLVKLEEHEPEMATSRDDECVICISAKATMQTFPCGHKVVCRKCFVRTIQMAVSQRVLPLRCVICRAKILRLKQSAPGKVHHLPSSAIYKNARPIASVLQETKDLPEAMLDIANSPILPPTKFCRQKLWNNKVADMPQPISPAAPTVERQVYSRSNRYSQAAPAYVHQKRHHHNRQPIRKPSALLPIPELEEFDLLESKVTNRITPSAQNKCPTIEEKPRSRSHKGAFSYFQQIRASSPLKAFRAKCK
ncbi:uncharacterized protein [Centruroides vittatus]|uniref:uncharacterized protein isoform X2 n=1 Tax=Centruroides vittatus TaxID=120091 RepID=UPI00350FCCD4